MSIYCRLHSPDGRDLVLTGCQAKVAVVDVHASVVMSQKFRNPLPTAISATYTFSMLAGSAIYGFEMVREDGTKVEGIVKEKEQAKKEYEEAVSQGYTASLGEEQTKDIFSISVGNILPSEIVTINIHFLQPLTDDEKKDQLRFTFPRAYAQRYGTAPTADAANAGTANQPFSLEVSIQQAGPIKSVACPSGHSISFEFGPPEGVTGVETSHFAKVSLKEASGSLTQDVLVVITASNLDAPRCFIEPHPSPTQPTTAVGLTFVPRFKLPDAETGMEYIFLIDRSGSMQGESIKLVRQALIVLLRGLPTKDTSFNLVSFGSDSSKLWPTSKTYTQQSLDEATRHVDTMGADYGGTEIASALTTVFDSLKKPLQKPVSVFLLTDGGAWDIDNCVTRTQTALKDLPGDKTFLRVFTVGIGNGVSTNTCDSIARAGKGISIYVSQGEAMTGKCSRLIRAARTPPVVDLKVCWPGLDKALQLEKDDADFELVEPEKAGEETEKVKETVNLFQSTDDKDDEKDVVPPPKPQVTLPPSPAIQQAPVTLPSLFPGTRAQFYAIVSEICFSKDSVMPKSVRVTGTVATTGVTVELDVPLAKLLVSPDSATTKPLLHTLAAKALITDRESGNESFPPSISKRFSKNEELKSAYLEKDIIRLGTTYSLTSKHTSFVAVDRREKNKEQILPRVEVAVAPAYDEREKSVGSAMPRKRLVGGGGGGLKFKAMNVTGGRLHRLVAPSAPPIPSPDGMAMPMAAPPPPPALSGAPAPPPARQSGGFGSLNSIRSSSSVLSKKVKKSVAKSSDTVSSSTPAQSDLLAMDYDEEEGRAKAPQPVDAGERLAAIARLQSFDGGFQLTRRLLVLISCSITDTAAVEAKLKSESSSLEGGIGATLLAWKWLRENAEEDALDMIEKAEEYLKDKLGKDGDGLDELSRKVLTLVPFV